MTKEEISKFADCAAEAYESVSYPLINYFVGHPCTKEELRTMWLFNLEYFYSRTLVYSDGPECNGWILWVAPGFKGVSVMNFIRYGGLKMTRRLGLDVISDAKLPGTELVHWGLAKPVVALR
ncbi:MAG: hypothetical protein KBT67_01355 [bacterium]|nr:hypothetical protein [Candidatus Limimorpha caballi]